jgi:hypothetical protein
MSASLKITDAASYKAYAEKNYPKILSKLFLGFPLAQICVPHSNIKGQVPLTEIIVSDLVKRWNKTFGATANAIEMQPRVLSTQLVKIDLEIIPQEFEGSYLGEMMKPGQNPDELPFQQYILDAVLAKKNEECERAGWIGDAAGSPASTDLLAAVINGFATIARDEATAGNLTPVTTGALSDDYAVEAFEDVYNSLGEAVRQREVAIICSKAAQTKYIRDYRSKHGANTITNDYMQFDLGKVKWITSQGTGDLIMMTLVENLHYGFDAESDNLLRFENSKRAIAMMMDFRIGFQFGIVHNSFLAINNQ